MAQSQALSGNGKRKPQMPMYTPSVLRTPYNTNIIAAINAKRAARKGIENYRNELRHMLVSEYNGRREDKLRSTGALNMIPTNNTPSGVGLPGDKYPEHTSGPYPNRNSDRLVNRVTHPRQYQFDNGQNRFDGPPAINDLHDNVLPETTYQRADAIKKGSRKRAAAARQILLHAYNDVKDTSSNPYMTDENPYAASGLGHRGGGDTSESDYSSDSDNYLDEEGNTEAW